MGRFVPEDVQQAAFQRLDIAMLKQLREAGGMSSTASDMLDELGYARAVPASVLAPRLEGRRPVAGHALTLRYLPERALQGRLHADGSGQKLAHHVVFGLARAGDVVVIEVAGGEAPSVLGGLAALAADRAGIAACIVDGGVRDLADIRHVGLPVWSRTVTPISGKGRVIGVAINRPISCGGVQVRPGDLVLADETGVCFVPPEVSDKVVERVLDVSRAELEQNRLAQVPTG